MPRVLESFKCPLQSFINDPIHSPRMSFVSAIKKCLPRALLHFLLLFCVFFKRRKKKKLAVGRTDLGQSQPRARELPFSKKQIFSKLWPRMSQGDLFIFIFLKSVCSGEEMLRGLCETRSVCDIKRCQPGWWVLGRWESSP